MVSFNDEFRKTGRVVIRNVFATRSIADLLRILGWEKEKRDRDGVSEEEREVFRKSSHIFSSFEKSDVMEKWLKDARDVVKEHIRPATEWISPNRQIIYRKEIGKYPMGYHVDGLSRIFEEGWEHTWPGFQILIGIPLMEVKGPGQGGLMVKPNSHLKVPEIYNAVAKYEGHFEALKACQKWEREEGAVDDGILLEVSPGDIEICHSLTMHKPDKLELPNTLDAKLYFRLKDQVLVGKRALEQVWSF